MVVHILLSESFQYVVLPLLLAFLGIGVKALSSPSRSVSSDSWLVGTDLCVEGWGMNLALAVGRTVGLNNLVSQSGGGAKFQEYMAVLWAISTVQFILLIGVMCILRFSRRSRLRVVLSDLLGAVAIAIAFFGWR